MGRYSSSSGPCFIRHSVGQASEPVSCHTKNSPEYVNLKGAQLDGVYDAGCSGGFLRRRSPGQAKELHLLSGEHFTVDGALVEAWAGH